MDSLVMPAAAHSTVQWELLSHGRGRIVIRRWPLPSPARCGARGLARCSSYSSLPTATDSIGVYHLILPRGRRFAVAADSTAGESRTSDCSPIATEEQTEDNNTQSEEDTSQGAGRRKEGLRRPEEGYVGLFVRMLGLDNPPEDREEAVKALWRHSMGGEKYIDEIMKFPGLLTLLVSLLPSNRSASSEGAAGLLRIISSVEVHRNAVAEAGAVEEIIGLLTRRTVSQEVREQAAGCLQNLAFEMNVRSKIDLSEFLPVLLLMLGSEGVGKDAAISMINNFTCDESNHETLVEAGIISKLGNLIKKGEGSRISRQEARNTLLLLARNSLFKQLIIEEGLVIVPIIGASAYQSFKPLLDAPPPFPEELKFDPSSTFPSTFGAGKLLLGLNMDSKEHKLDDATQLAIEGRARQHFLGRIGLLGKDAAPGQQKKNEFTIMPWWDGIPRLVLILGLEDVNVAALAARTISEIAINEDIRQAIQKAGSIPHLVRLLGTGNESATEAAASALERLAVSYKVRKVIDAHDAVPALVAILKADGAPDQIKAKVLAALQQLTQTGEEVKAMIQSGAFPGLLDFAQSESASPDAKEEVKGILEELSLHKVDAREKIVDTNGLSTLVELVASGTPTLKVKAAHVLENLAIKENYVECITEARLEAALKSVLDVNLKGEDDALTTEELIEREETWAAVVAASRMLNKLLMFGKVRSAIDCEGLAELLAKVLKSNSPLHVKDWVSACLLKLDRLVGLTTNVGIPVEKDVILHDKIPRLINEMGTSFDSSAQEKAVIELREILSRGIEEYVVAVSDSGGIYPLVELVDKGSPVAREAGLSILYNVAMNDENHPAIMAAGAVTVLQRLVRAESPEWTLALDILRLLPI